MAARPGDVQSALHGEFPPRDIGLDDAVALWCEYYTRTDDHETTVLAAQAGGELTYHRLLVASNCYARDLSRRLGLRSPYLTTERRELLHRAKLIASRWSADYCRKVLDRRALIVTPK